MPPLLSNKNTKTAQYLLRGRHKRALGMILSGIASLGWSNY